MDDQDFFGPGGASGGVSYAPQSALDVAREAIAHNETGHIALRGGNPYAAVGPTIKRKSGFVDNALGRYQIMRSNLRKWTEEALGHPLSEKEFLASPEAQDAVFNHRFGNYLMKYSPEDAAAMWFSGRPLDQARKASDGHWTTEQYAKNFSKNLGGEISGEVSEASPEFGPGVEIPEPETLSPRQAPVPVAEVPRRGLPPITVERPAQWGLPQAALYGATLGQSPALAGLAGADPDAMRKARMLYMAQNPLGELVGEFGGAIVPTALATGTGMMGLAAAGRAIPALRGVAAFLGGAAGEGMGGLGGFALRRASDLGYGATQGAIQGAVESPLGQGSLADQVKQGALWGGVLGGPMNALLGRPLTAFGRAGVTPEKEALYDAAKQRGIEMYAPQLSDNAHVKALPIEEGNLHGQVEAFNKALAKGVGSSDDHLTEAALAQHKDVLGNEIGTITSRHDIVPTPDLVTDLKDILTNAHSNLVDDADIKKLTMVFRKVADELKEPGGLTGKKFQNFLTSGGLLSNMAKDPVLAPYASQLRGALNRAFEKAIPAGHPDVGALSLAKQRYAAVKQIEKEIAKASPEMVSPQAIHKVTRAPAKPGKPVPQELKTLGDIGKYLPGVNAMGQLRGHSSPYWRIAQAAGPAGLLGAGYLGHDYIQRVWDTLPPEWKTNGAIGALMLGAALTGRGVGHHFLQRPGINERIVRGSIPSLPLSYNPLVAGQAQVGTRRD